MTVQLAGISYQPVRSYSVAASRPGLKLVSLNKLDQSRSIASKASFQASMEKAMLSQRYWDDLLEKLRKSGGGGGDNSKFDRITVSMQLMDFISNKQIEAIIKNMNLELLNLQNDIQNQMSILLPTGLITNLVRVSTNILSGISSFTGNIARILNLQNIPKIFSNVTTHLTLFLGNISFQLNKLKEILEEDFKELLRKLDIKGKFKKIKSVVLDLFIEMKDEVLDLVQSLKFFIVKMLEC